MEREGIMRPDDNFHGGITMENNRFVLAGWISIMLAVLTLPGSFMHIMIDIKHKSVFLPFSAGLDLISMGLGIYVLIKVKDWLNATYDFHDLDSIIPMLIAGNIVIVPLAVTARVYGFGESLYYLIPMYGVIAGLSIMMIVFSARFLRVEGTMRGLKKPIAWIGISIAICFLSFILMPLGMVLGIAYNLLIGLALLQSPSEAIDYV